MALRTSWEASYAWLRRIRAWGAYSLFGLTRMSVSISVMASGGLPLWRAHFAISTDQCPRSFSSGRSHCQVQRLSYA